MNVLLREYIKGVLIDVPKVKQKDEYSCGPASLKMILKRFGDCDKSQSALAKAMDADPNKGTSHASLIAAARDICVSCKEYNNASLKDIKSQLVKGNPVIVNIVMEDGEGHYAVVVGIDEDEVTMNDPWSGKEDQIEIESFKKRWRNESGTSTRWMVALKPD